MKKFFGRIAPVGNPISLDVSDEIPEFPGSLQTFFLDSGTAALAAALHIAQQHCAAENPEVIIPAYCCPDLLSAIIYNKMRPVLVDFVPDRPHMDLEKISESLNENTVAVIAVNFLGIPERLDAIKKILEDRKTLLIEDSAQWFPESIEAYSSHEGDLVIYSFGKGKPVSLLGGGALSVRTEKIAADSSALHQKIITRHTLNALQREKKKLSFRLFNMVISPFFYWLLEFAPFISLGETRYKPLNSLGSISDAPSIFLAKNILQYQTNSSAIQKKWETSLLPTSKQSTQLLHHNCGTYNSQRLLRTPIIFDSEESRESFITEAIDDGLGGSRLYAECLPKIANVPQLTAQPNDYPNAESFSKRVATLPNHSGVKKRHIESIRRLLDSQISA